MSTARPQSSAVPGGIVPVDVAGIMPDGPPLSRATWDRAGLHRGDEAWVAQAWSTARVLIISPDSATPVDATGQLATVEAADAPAGPRRLLGLVEGRAWFAVTAEPDERHHWMTLREIGQSVGDLPSSLLATAIGLEQWHQRNPHCPHCGARTTETAAGWIRTCPVDHSNHFPRTDPAVIMLVHDGHDQVLLGRNSRWDEGRYSCLAGFVEPGETFEEAVAREVFEEVGVTTTDIRYIATQPWPFPASLMIGFSAELVGAPELNLDPVEMAEAGWFSRDEIRQARTWTDEQGGPPTDVGTRLLALPPRLSIARFMIDRWLADD